MTKNDFPRQSLSKRANTMVDPVDAPGALSVEYGAAHGEVFVRFLKFKKIISCTNLMKYFTFKYKYSLYVFGYYKFITTSCNK